ncbi:hypothetical protein TNCV_3545811, partial [Trichonephila clavipes]
CLEQKKAKNWAVGSLVVRASDSRPEGLGSMLDVTKYPPSAHPSLAEIVEVEIEVVSPSIVPFGESFTELKSHCHPWCSRPTTGVPLAHCTMNFSGPRSDYVKQVALATTTKQIGPDASQVSKSGLQG